MTAPAIAPVAAPTSRFRYEEKSGRYKGPSGRYLAASTVREEVDRVLAAADGRARALGELLRQRQLSTRDWELQMRREIKRAQIVGYAAAAGGAQHLSPADYGRIGAAVKQQYAYLRRFRAQIEQGRTDGSYALDGRFLRRVELYTEAGREMYHATETRRMERLGYLEYRNVRHAADSCATCLEATSAGWVPIGTLPPIGQRDCGKRCRCSLSYRKPDQADGAG